MGINASHSQQGTAGPRLHQPARPPAAVPQPTLRGPMENTMAPNQGPVYFSLAASSPSQFGTWPEFLNLHRLLKVLQELIKNVIFCLRWSNLACLYRTAAVGEQEADQTTHCHSITYLATPSLPRRKQPLQAGKSSLGFPDPLHIIVTGLYHIFKCEKKVIADPLLFLLI